MSTLFSQVKLLSLLFLKYLEITLSILILALWINGRGIFTFLKKCENSIWVFDLWEVNWIEVYNACFWIDVFSHKLIFTRLKLIGCAVNALVWQLNFLTSSDPIFYSGTLADWNLLAWMHVCMFILHRTVTRITSSKCVINFHSLSWLELACMWEQLPMWVFQLVGVI